MLRAMRFVEVTLAAPPALLPELEAFYDGITGETTLRFEPGEGEPFYHFALLVPGDRFDATHAWAEERFELVGGVFEFENWDARAVYFLDPAGNIVELIAHRGLEESGRDGEFGADEIVGFSELGLVGNRAENLRISRLPLWSGTIDDPESLAFVGEKGRTLILAEEGRGWLPTGRPAEAHPVEFELLR
jgi:catechol 2,3-dioxygenase-like lactoylglutathione lyase family enzyme